MNVEQKAMSAIEHVRRESKDMTTTQFIEYLDIILADLQVDHLAANDDLNAASER